MAHQIETHGTRTPPPCSPAQDPWHRLGHDGRRVTAFTAEDAMTLGHLGGWDVRKVARQLRPRSARTA
jgi:hypothetical protein